ncbi:MAG TPA: phospholipase [Aeromonadales bacterium]|nr:phospholipase [Aeromonadales bacterium]
MSSKNKKYPSQILLLSVLLICTSIDSRASTSSEKLDKCYLKRLKAAGDTVPVIEIKKRCQVSIQQNVSDKNSLISPLDKRLHIEKETQNIPNVITAHMLNYMLPVTYMTNPNADLGNLLLDQNAKLDRTEAKFQISFKAPLTQNIFNQQDAVYFAFTLQSYWQMYNKNISSPFRETNYQPEIFYWYENDLKWGDWSNRVIMIGFQHQSNGRSQPLSRSWNRFFANFVWEKDSWVLSFKPWYRLPESKKDDPLQAKGDDNPDIEKFMGNFEFRSIYKWDEQTFSLMFRNNLRSNNKGAVELGWTFPMGKRFKGYAQFFSGYGESLIDYNHNINRFGIGIVLTDYF